MALELVRREGVRGLYAGLSPAILRHVFYTGTRITVYEQLRSASSSSSTCPSPTSPSSGASSSSSPSTGSNGSRSGNSSTSSSSGGGVGSRLLMGLTAGAVGQAVAVPADLIKVRLQGEG
ncbi:hypothetical protein Agub_g2321, partial [Astrephomene gubernaculifera]